MVTMSPVTIEIVDQLIYSYLNRRQYTSSVDVFLRESTLSRLKSTGRGKETLIVESCPTVHGKNLEEIIEGFSRYAQPNLPWPFYEFATKIRALANDYSTLCDQTYSVNSSSSAGLPSCSQQAVPTHDVISGTRSVSNTNNNNPFSSVHSDEHISMSHVQQQNKQDYDRSIESVDAISRDSQEATSSNKPESSMHGLTADRDSSNGGSRRKQSHPIGREDLTTFKTIEMIGSKLSGVVNASLHNDSGDENIHSNISQLTMSDIDDDLITLVEDLVQYTPFPFMDDLIRTDQALANFPDPAPAVSSQSCPNVLNIPMATPAKSLQHNADFLVSPPRCMAKSGDSFAATGGQKEMDADYFSITKDLNSVGDSLDRNGRNEKPKPKKLPWNERSVLQNLVIHEAKNVPPVSYSAENSGTSLNVLFGDDDDSNDPIPSRPRSNSSVSLNPQERIADRSTYKESQRSDDYKDRNLAISRDSRPLPMRVPCKEDSLGKRAGHANIVDSKQTSRNQRGGRDSSPQPRKHADVNRSRDLKRDQDRKRREEAMQKKSAEDRKRREEASRKRKEEETERRQRKEEEKRRQHDEELEIRRLEELRRKDLESQLTANDAEIHRELLLDKEISRKEEHERAEKRRIREEGKSFRHGSNFEKKKNTHENKKPVEYMPESLNSTVADVLRKNSNEEYKPTGLASSKRTNNDLLSKIEMDVDSGWSSDPALASLASSQRKNSSKALQSIPRIPKRSIANSPSDHSRSPSISGKILETATTCHSGRSSRNSSITEPSLSNGISSETTSKIVASRKNTTMIGYLMASWKPSVSRQSLNSSELSAADPSLPNFSKSSINVERDVRSDEELNSTANKRQSVTRPVVATDFSKMLSSPMKKVAESSSDSNVSVANLDQGYHHSPPRKKQKINLNKASVILDQIHGK